MDVCVRAHVSVIHLRVWHVCLEMTHYFYYNLADSIEEQSRGQDRGSRATLRMWLLCIAVPPRPPWTADRVGCCSPGRHSWQVIPRPDAKSAPGTVC